MANPPPHVLDLFAVPDVLRSLPGGQGQSVLAGDLVLSPGRDPVVEGWLSPVLARLAYELDSTPGPRPLRVAMPVPARDGAWVVDGWAASRYEPGTVPCRDLDVALAAGRLLHARLASVVRTRPRVVAERTDRWAVAERFAFRPVELRGGAESGRSTAGSSTADVARLVALLDDRPLGPDQLVHADLAGNVLLDAGGAAVVIDVAPSWRPHRWAEAVCVLDAVTWHGADPAVLAGWATGVTAQAMLRALLFRMLSDGPLGQDVYAPVLDVVAPR